MTTKLQAIQSALIAEISAMTLAGEERDRARRHHTDMTNKVNARQKEFDDAVAVFKKLAPSGTDWGSKACKTRAEL